MLLLSDIFRCSEKFVVQSAMLFVLLLVQGCGMVQSPFSMSNYESAVRSGLQSIPEARQFDEIFGAGNVDHFISYHGSRDIPSEWFTEVWFKQRYKLTMVVPVEVNRSFSQVKVKPGEPKFYFADVYAVETTANGQLMSSMREVNGAPVPFTLNDWNTVYKAGGMFSAIGVDDQPKPTERFEDFVLLVRKDRVQVDRSHDIR